jgi:hypothetical protein
MDTNNEKIIAYIDGEMNAVERTQFREELRKDTSLAEDYSLQINVNKYMKNFIETKEILREAEDKNLNVFIHEMLRNRPKKNELSDIRRFVASGWYLDSEDMSFLSENDGNESPDALTQKWAEEWHQNNGTFSAKKAGKPDYDFVSQAFNKVPDETAITKQAGKPRHKIIRLVRKQKVLASIVAAAIIILFAVVLVPKEKPGPKDLYADFYEPFEQVNFVQRNADGSIDHEVVNGIKAYNEGRFFDATDVLSDVIKEGKVSATTHFYNGLAQMETGEFNKAVVQFEYLLSNYYVYGQEATWYMALCHLQTGNIAKTKKALRELTKEKGIYREKAANLLRKLD